MAGETELTVNYNVQKVRRTEWAGHLVGISDDTTVKEVLLKKLDGRRRRVERQKLIWLDCCEEDLKLMGVKGWKEKAEDICMGYHSKGGNG
jgi:hypothetical protein